MDQHTFVNRFFPNHKKNIDLLFPKEHGDMRLVFISWVLVPLFFITPLPIRSPEAAHAGHAFTIIYTNDVQGEIEPCG
jgi:hypothetical protein